MAKGLIGLVVVFCDAAYKLIGRRDASRKVLLIHTTPSNQSILTTTVNRVPR